MAIRQANGPKQKFPHKADTLAKRQSKMPFTIFYRSSMHNAWDPNVLLSRQVTLHGKICLFWNARISAICNEIPSMNTGVENGPPLVKQGYMEKFPILNEVRVLL
jgi:hypothetical protein